MSQRLLYKTKVVNIYIFITETIEGLNKVKKNQMKNFSSDKGPWGHHYDMGSWGVPWREQPLPWNWSSAVLSR